MQVDERYVILHKPGRAWRTGAPIFEQEGIREHGLYYRKLGEQGLIDMGGPFVDGQGGMVVPRGGLTRAEVETLANGDPTVASGLIEVELKPWMVVSNHRA